MSEYDTVRRGNVNVIGKALAGGAGAAAISAMLHEYMTAKQEAERDRKRKGGDDGNTIYLNIRRPGKKKGGESEKDGESIPDDSGLHSRTFSKVRRVEEVDEETRDMHDEGAMRYRDILGRFSGSDEASKSASYIVDAVSLAAGIDQLSDMKNKQLARKLDPKGAKKTGDKDGGGSGDGPEIEVSDDEAREFVRKNRKAIMEALSGSGGKSGPAEKGKMGKKAYDIPVGDKITRILGGTVAAAGGFYLVDKLARELEKRRMKRQLDAIRNEYVDAVVGDSEKMASYPLLSGVLMVGGSEKRAGAIGDILSAPAGMVHGFTDTTALMGAGYIGTALLTAYLTKKFLDYKLGNGGDKDEFEPEKVRRIVFRTSGDGSEKTAGAREIEVDPADMLATVCLYVKAAEYMASTPLQKEAWGRNGAGRSMYYDPAARLYALEYLANDNGWLPKGYVYRGDRKPWRFNHETKKLGFLSQLREHPELMMQTLSENPALRDAIIDGNFRSSHEWLSKVPGLGDIVRWFMTNTPWGRKMMMENVMRRSGATSGQIASAMSGMDFSNGYGNAPAPEEPDLYDPKNQMGSPPDIDPATQVANHSAGDKVVSINEYGRPEEGTVEHTRKLALRPRTGHGQYVEVGSGGDRTFRTQSFEMEAPETSNPFKWHGIDRARHAMQNMEGQLYAAMSRARKANATPEAFQQAMDAFWNSPEGQKMKGEMKRYGIRYLDPSRQQLVPRATAAATAAPAETPAPATAAIPQQPIAMAAPNDAKPMARPSVEKPTLSTDPVAAR